MNVCKCTSLILWWRRIICQEILTQSIIEYFRYSCRDSWMRMLDSDKIFLKCKKKSLGKKKYFLPITLKSLYIHSIFLFGAFCYIYKIVFFYTKPRYFFRAGCWMQNLKRQSLRIFRERNFNTKPESFYEQNHFSSQSRNSVVAAFLCKNVECSHVQNAKSRLEL